MADPKLLQSAVSSPVQVFTLIKGRVNLTSGDYTDVSLIYCVADGNIVITWNDLTTSTIACTEKDCFGIGACNKVTVSPDSGTFHLN